MPINIEIESLLVVYLLVSMNIHTRTGQKKEFCSNRALTPKYTVIDLFIFSLNNPLTPCHHLAGPHHKCRGPITGRHAKHVRNADSEATALARPCVQNG